MVAVPALNAADAVVISSRAGTSTGQFLKMDMGARHAALGGTYAGYGHDIYSLWGQPAALADAPDAWQIGFQHTAWFAGVTHEYGGIALPSSDRSRIGIVVNTLGADGIARTSEDVTGGYAGTAGTFGARDWALSLNYALRINARVSFGVAARYIRSDIDNVTANGFAADLGIRYRISSIEGLSLGASVTNVGTGLKYLNRRDAFPTAVRVGASYDIPSLKLLAALDAVKYIDRDVDAGVGVEWRPVEMLKLRAGYRTQGIDAGQGVTAGVGFEYSDLQLDYAYVPFGPLGDVHRVSATYLFGKSR